MAGKIDCSAETVRMWVLQAERAAGTRPGLTSDERAQPKTLERENRELRRANEILRKASVDSTGQRTRRRAPTRGRPPDPAGRDSAIRTTSSRGGSVRSR